MRRPTPHPATVAVAISVLVGNVFALTQARRLYFFGDDWEFLLDRTLSWSGVMEPHNEHWSTLPVISFRVMVHLLGVDHYLAFAALPLLLHAAACGLLYALMRRNEVAAWPAAIVTIPFAFLAGNIGENPLWDFQIGFLGSAVLGLVALHLQRGGSRAMLLGTYAVTVLSLMSSGMALFMIAWLGGYLLLTRGLLRALVVTVPPGLVYLLWYAAYGRDATAQAPNASASLVVEFTAQGLTAAWQALVRVPAGGTIAIIGLTAFVLLARLTERQRALALAGFMTLAATYVLLGTSRAGLGPQAATASRYSYFALLFTLPALALLLATIGDRLQERATQRWVAATVLTLVLTINGISQTLAFVDGRVSITEDLRGQIAATEQLIDQDQEFLVDRISMPYNPDVTIKALSRPDVRADLSDDVTVDQVTLLNASLSSQVAVDTRSFDLPAPSHLRRNALVGTTVQGGCADLLAKPGAWFDISDSSGGLQVRLTSQAPGYSVQLLSEGDVSDPLFLTTQPDLPIFVASTSSSGRLRVNLPSGPINLCLPADEPTAETTTEPATD